MALNDFFRINMPYGIKANENKAWTAFNREYLPLGFNYVVDLQSPNFIYTKYKGITEKVLSQIAWHAENGIKRDVFGDINMVFFYNDGTNPQSHPQYWNEYFEKIKKLSTFKVIV
jgi:hypothetical protein